MSKSNEETCRCVDSLISFVQANKERIKNMSDIEIYNAWAEETKENVSDIALVARLLTIAKSKNLILDTEIL